MVNLIVLLLSVFLSQDAKSNSGPLVSTTDPFYFSCTVWTGKAWTPVSARSVQTPEIESRTGYRAYGEAQVTVDKDGSCANTTELFVASPGDDSFKLVYSKTPANSDGNGIRLIAWAPSGDKLLAEVNLWRYETDGGYGHVAVIYDGSTKSATEIPSLYRALTKHFGKNCEFDFAVQRWSANDQIIVKVSKALEDPSYEQHFCVERPRLFVFDLANKTLRPNVQP